MLVYHHNIETKDTGCVRKSFRGETEKTERWERNKALAKKNYDDPESDDSSNHKSNGLKCKYCGTKFRWEANLNTVVLKGVIGLQRGSMSGTYWNLPLKPITIE